eukprot:3795477-Prorocentrum_lima.AAC.1
MTSSLVGSEMCIRDRLRRLPRASTGPATGRKRKRERERGRSEGEERTGSVSYTHLTLPTICSV